MRTSCAKLSLLTLLLACGDATGDRNEPALIDTLSSGAIHVTNAHAGSWDGNREWIFRETSRIGRLDGEGADVFGRIAGLDLGADGTTYVYDGFAREIRIFDSSGRNVTTVGGRGAGPQELESVVGIAMAPDGQVWLVDAGNSRYVRLAADGLLETVRRPIAVYTLPWLGGWDRDGYFHDQASVLREDRTASVLVRMSQPGTVRDSTELPVADLRQPGMGSMAFPLPFAPRQLWAFDPAGRIWTAIDTAYVLTAVDLVGDTVAVVRRSHERVPLSPAHRDSVRTYADNLRSRFGVDVPAAMIPTVAPVLRWITIDDSGCMWVCATGLDSCDVVDVFDPLGVYLGTVDLPVPATGRLVVRGNFAAYSAEGPSTEPVVVVGQIEGRQRP